jgi:hypothetical protein
MAAIEAGMCPHRPIVLLLLIHLMLPLSVAQTAPDTWWVRFTDKAATPHSLDQPEHYLSPQAIARRQRQGIPLDSLDLPVVPAYVEALRAAGGITVLNRSRWFNAVTIRSTDSLALDTLHLLPFVAEVKALPAAMPQGAGGYKYPTFTKQEIGGYYPGIYGASFRQLAMMNGHLLHTIADARGEGMLIGVLDSGFEDADILPAFNDLRARQGIALTHDLVHQGGDVYRAHWHGRSVLSVLAGMIPGKLHGSAPMARYALFRTEEVASEYPWEEDNWVSGAEIADSLGCDVLNTSLGYTTFDDSSMDHSYADMDGLTTRSAIASGIASAKGMIVVTSAGNKGTNWWFHISTPADARDILAVGAVDAERRTAPFSSRGPSADGRIKPDVAAMGEGTIGLGVDGSELVTINGTSFSSPLVAGLVACLWQLHPDRTAAEVMDAVRRTASQAAAPDTEQGYGIPDFWKAHLLLDGRPLPGTSGEQLFSVDPNPFVDHFMLDLYAPAAARLRLELSDAMGREVWAREQQVEGDVLIRLRLGDATLQALPAGTYVLQARLGGQRMVRTLVKAAR